MQDAADEAGYPASEIGIYLQPIAQGSGCHCEFNVFYDPTNAAEAERVRKLSSELTLDLMAKGAFFSRPYGTSVGAVMNRQGDSLEVLKKVKRILDPNNVMNPGKLGF
jgi:FAD/FMN-containing dehydrogenase